MERCSHKFIGEGTKEAPITIKLKQLEKFYWRSVWFKNLGRESILVVDDCILEMVISPSEAVLEFKGDEKLLEITCIVTELRL